MLILTNLEINTEKTRALFCCSQLKEWWQWRLTGEVWQWRQEDLPSLNLVTMIGNSALADCISHENVDDRRSSEIQGTALGKSLRAWTCIYRSMPTGVGQSRHAFVGGTVSMWGR